VWFWLTRNSPWSTAAFLEPGVRNWIAALLPSNHVWAGVNIARQPARALDAISRAVIDHSVARFKQPVGPLREVTETCPRTGRVTTRFFGDPEECWAPFKQPRLLARFTNSVGRGADSPAGRAGAAEHAMALEIGRAAMAAQP
jgi:hypothetical protein